MRLFQKFTRESQRTCFWEFDLETLLNNMIMTRNGVYKQTLNIIWREKKEIAEIWNYLEKDLRDLERNKMSYIESIMQNHNLMW